MADNVVSFVKQTMREKYHQELEKGVNDGIIDQSEIGPKKPITDGECVDCLENICKMFVNGSKNCEGQALEYQLKYISAIRYAIAKIQGGNNK